MIRVRSSLLFTLPPTSLRIDLDADVYTYSLELTVKTTVSPKVRKVIQDLLKISETSTSLIAAWR
jgi:hypothetical protein